MSSKSRRGAHTSRRRASVVTGVLLAGAAIPFAAAGTAWADAESTQIEHQDKVSLTQAEAQAHAAAADGVPVEISKNGVVIFEANNPVGNDTTATSGKGDTAVAIGVGADATAQNGTADFAFADGNLANAYAGGESGKVSSSDTAEDIGTNVGNNNGAVAGGSGGHNTALDIGNNTFTCAIAPCASNGATAVFGSYNTALDIGNNIGAADGAKAGGASTSVLGNYETAIDIGNNGTTAPGGSVELSGAQAQDGTRDTAIYAGNTTVWAEDAQAADGKYDTATVSGNDSSAIALLGNDNSVSISGDDNAAYAGGATAASPTNSNTVNIVGAEDTVTARGGSDHIGVFVSDAPLVEVSTPKVTESVEPFGTFIP